MATTTPTGVRGGHAKHGGAEAPDGAPMTHRQIMEALTGLLLGMFVAILSSTVVSNALPTSSPTSVAARAPTPGSSPPPCWR